VGRTDLKQDGRGVFQSANPEFGLTAELRQHGRQGDRGKKWLQGCTNTHKHKPILHNITPSYCIIRL